MGCLAVCLAALLLPVVEAFLLWRLGHHIGLGTLLGILVVTAFIGHRLARNEGWHALQQAIQMRREGAAPDIGIISAFLVFLGGGLLAFPGPISDLIGLVLLLRPTRALIARTLRRRWEPAIASGSLRFNVESDSHRPPTTIKEVDGALAEHHSEVDRLLQSGARLAQARQFEQALSLYDQILARFGDTADPALDESIALAFFDKGVTLDALGRSDQAVRAYDEIVARFGDSAKPEVRFCVATALYNKGGTLGALARLEESVAVYDDLVARFGDHPEAAIQEVIIMGLFNQIDRLAALPRLVEQGLAYDAILARCHDDSLQVQGHLVMGEALHGKSVVLRKLGRFDDARESFRQVVDWSQKVPQIDTRGLAMQALTGEGVVLSEQGRFEDALRSFDQAVNLAVGTDDATVDLALGIALMTKASVLNYIGRSEAAAQTHEKVIARFARSKDARIQEMVQAAIANRGVRRE